MTRRRRAAPALDAIPDVRDGLTTIERVVLVTLHRLQKERGDRNVPTTLLYGHVLEQIPIGIDELQRVLERLGGKR